MPAFLAAWNSTLHPTVKGGGGGGARAPLMKLALQCDDAARCSIPDELCLPNGRYPVAQSSCLTVARKVQVFMKNVDLGPHSNLDPMGAATSTPF